MADILKILFAIALLFFIFNSNALPIFETIKTLITENLSFIMLIIIGIFAWKVFEK